MSAYDPKLTSAGSKFRTTAVICRSVICYIDIRADNRGRRLR